MAHVGGAGDTPNTSLLTDQAQVEKTVGNSKGHNVQQTDVPPQLNGLAPNQTSRTPIGDRDTTHMDETSPTPGLSKPSDDKDLPALEKVREDMLKEAGELMQKNEELTVLGFALRSLQPRNYDEKLRPPQGLKVTLQMSPGAPIYTVEPPDDAFKALPEDQRNQMKKMAYDLLINHTTTAYQGYDPRAGREQVEKLKEQLERNGEEIGKRGGDNNWRDRFTKLEHRPAHIVVNSDSTGGAKVTVTDEKDKPKSQVKVSTDDVPADDDTPTTPVSSSGIDLNNNLLPPAVHGKIMLVSGDITKLDYQWGIQVDAITNAANGDLQEGNGVCGDIFTAAGNQNLKTECDQHGACPTGEVRTTGAHGLSSQGVKYIIHAVAPDRREPEYASDTNKTNFALREAYKNIMREAETLGLGRVAIPVLGSGSFGIDADWSTEVAASVIAEYQEANPKAPEVVFVVYPGTQNSGKTDQQTRTHFENELRDRNQSGYLKT